MALLVAPLPDALGFGLFAVAMLGMGAVVLKTAINGIVKIKTSRQLPPSAPHDDDGRVSAQEEEVRELRASLERVTSIVEFDHQLRGGAEPPTRLPGA